MKMHLFVLLSLSLGTTAAAAPKYGPNAVPISKKTNLEYFQKNAAPDYWALSPYYLPQPTGRACSAANLAMILNGARAGRELTSDDRLITVEDFAKKIAGDKYAHAVLGKGLMDRTQVTNQNMAKILNDAAAKLNLKTDKTLAKVADIDAKNVEASKKAFLEALKQNEKSADDFIFFSFVQGVLTGDPEGGAHVATVGGYDEKKGLVLVFDPDREWYEPYWTPVDQLFASIQDPKSDGINPGWIHFQVR